MAIAPTPDARPAGFAGFCRPYHAGGSLAELVSARLRVRAETLGGQSRDNCAAGKGGRTRSAT